VSRIERAVPAAQELRDVLVRALADARRATLALLEGLEEHELRSQYHPEFSPIAWHYGHAAWQEECFVARCVGGHAALEPELDAVFDPAICAKSSRTQVLPDRAFLDDYVQRVRSATLELLSRTAFEDSELLREGHVFRFVANHELQHAEIMAVVRLLGGLELASAPALPLEPSSPARIHVPGGSFVIGSDDDPDRWDNEQRAHPVELAELWLAPRLVSSSEWLEFMQAGGYEDRGLWTEAGWQWRNLSEVRAPLHWQRGTDGSWLRRDLRGMRPLVPDEAVAHVSWYEASAFARFAGGRLPREAEWEKAAHGPSGAYMLGRVWQWTVDAFAPYPGFSPQPYREYSAPWFDGRHLVARGGSYLSARAMRRPTFRNWYLPHIRQPVLGLRLAFDQP
jgi:gamma-glutamyl hercynylcysteine S-oxide synthase